MERDSEIINQLAERIRLLRVARRWSQEALAAACDMNRNYVGMVECGKINPGLTHINRFARAFGLMSIRGR